MIEFITNQKKVFAQIIRSTYRSKKGVSFFTDSKYIQQVAFMSHKKGHKISPHYHKKIKRIIHNTSEVLIILSGCMEVKFYSQKKIFFKKKTLKKGDIIILLSGGHSFFMKKNCKFLEIKQGPYLKSKDKIRFEE